MLHSQLTIDNPPCIHPYGLTQTETSGGGGRGRALRMYCYIRYMYMYAGEPLKIITLNWANYWNLVPDCISLLSQMAKKNSCQADFKFLPTSGDHRFGKISFRSSLNPSYTLQFIRRPRPARVPARRFHPWATCAHFSQYL